MTPSLLQKIELLTLNQLELCDLMTEEMVKNPFLEEVPDGADPEASKETPNEESEQEEKPKDSLEDFDYDYFFSEYLSPPFRNREYEIPEDRPTFEMFLSTSTSLIDHLEWQITMSEVPKEIEPIIDYMIGNINEDGYLTCSMEEVQSSSVLRCRRWKRRSGWSSRLIRSAWVREISRSAS